MKTKRQLKKISNQAIKKNEEHKDESTSPFINKTDSNELAERNDNCSRLIAKNLPGTGKKKWDESRIRNYFGKFGTITDVKLKLNDKTGACRFAFIGFEDPNSCKTAIEKLSGSFLHGTKLQIEQCKPLTEDRKDVTNKLTLLKLKQKGESQPNLSEENFNVNELQERLILDTGRLFVRNLPFSCTESNLNDLFSPFGPIAEIQCIITRKGDCKGFAICTFMFPEHALAAWKELDGKIFMGRMLHIIAGKEKKKTNTDKEGKTLSNFQQDRMTNRMENAGKTSHTWNALFLGSNAVAETLADNYDVEKRHLLLDEGENSAAVRMAMAETRLVKETRKFFIENGIKLDAFSQPLEKSKRSKTVILVKNLCGKPSEQDQLKRLFIQYGHLKSVIMPPVHGISALVEMGNELDAKRAFEALAYNKKLNGQPIYLEWAPVDVFDDNRPKQSSKTNLEIENKNNISQNDGATAEVNETKGTDKKEVTKILVRNVPFQANVKEISQLFSAFGELKFIRMPKKPGGEGHRGFCFVDFISTGDAKRAMESLVHSTHLYGRRLVLEWAKQEETIDELRNKTKRRMHLMNNINSKKTKIRSFAAVD